MLYPEYHYRQQDEHHVIRCKTEPKPLDLLVFDEKIKKEIREKGYWIVQKYNIKDEHGRRFIIDRRERVDIRYR